MKRLLILGGASSLLIILIVSFLGPLLEPWENKTVDFRFKLRGPMDTHPSLILINADDTSANRYGRWPWERSIHTHMINFLKENKVKSILYDILFAQPTDQAMDSELTEAVQKAGNVIMPLAVSFEDNGSPGPQQEYSEIFSKTHFKKSPVSRNFLKVTRLITPLKDLMGATKFLGHVASNKDMDGVIRRVPILVQLDGNLVPSFSFQAVLSYLSIPSQNVEVKPNAIILKNGHFPGIAEPINREIPIDDKGQMLINFPGKWTQTFKHASFAMVLEDETKITERLEDLENKMVLISNTMSGQDIKSIPLEKDYPGSGIHASIINGILMGKFLNETPLWLNFLVILLIGFATALVFSWRNGVIQFGLLVIILLAYNGICIVFFNHGTVLNMVGPNLTAVLSALVISIYQAGFERERSGRLLDEKAKLENELSRISLELSEKEKELENVQRTIDGLEEERVRGIEAGGAQAEQIAELQMTLKAITDEREEIIKEKEELLNRLGDYEVFPFPDILLDPKHKNVLIQEAKEFGITTRNSKMLEAFTLVKRVADVPTPLLILGETGTGKEVFARALHNMSPRKDQPFVAVNMAAIPESLVESEMFGHSKGAFTGAVGAQKGRFLEADRGTIFLDEIGEIPLPIQTKLLRVLQEKEIQPLGGRPTPVNVRIVSSTNKVLEEEIKRGHFREDLFFRLNTLTIQLCPLRERKEDIELLVPFFMDKYVKEFKKNVSGVSQSAMQTLMAYGWRGNIRELENVIQRAVTLCQTDIIQVEDLGLNSDSISDHIEISPAPDKANPEESILQALGENAYEINATAQQLNLTRNTVASRFKGICFKKLVEHQMDIEKVVKEMAPDISQHKLVQQKIEEYRDNLITTVMNFDSEEEAVQEALRKAKNVPTEYHPAIKHLVEILYKNQR